MVKLKSGLRQEIPSYINLHRDGRYISVVRNFPPGKHVFRSQGHYLELDQWIRSEKVQLIEDEFPVITYQRVIIEQFSLRPMASVSLIMMEGRYTYILTVFVIYA